MPKSNRPATRRSSDSDPPAGRPRELIVIARQDAPLQGATDMEAAVADTDGLGAILAAHGATIEPLFPGAERMARPSIQATVSGDKADDATDAAASFDRFFHVVAPDDDLDALASDLMLHDDVEAAYVKPVSEPPVAAVIDAVALNDMQPTVEAPPAVTPDFVDRQTYLDAAPGGIDARYAWTVPGGSGQGVRIIDCEWGWRFTHEDLLTNQGGVVAGTSSTDTNHGTAVLGEISGDRNGLGVTGIAPDAVISASSFSQPTATAIRQAADRLGPGDIILLEIHRAGPNSPTPLQGQLGFIAVEWWPDDFAAIRYAVNKGIVVVEAAGNGAENLDAAVYDVRPLGFPMSWTNPFNAANPSSGAVLVGAGAPPPGTHGQNHGPDRSRLDFSNFGARVDTQGWGREVTSTGYGDLQGGTNPDLWYTNRFSGTSSASPIVVGALACVQGTLRARGRVPLSPARARELLRSTGSPQQAGPNAPVTQRIGNRPDLHQLIPAALQTLGPWTGVQFHGSVPANSTMCWFTFNWPAHWHVLWTVVPTSPRQGAPQITWRVKVERATDAFATYWICITNVTPVAVDVEGRYAVLGA
jgi:Subtilase family